MRSTSCRRRNSGILKVIAALITLFLQRRDERRAAKSEIRTPGDARDVSQGSTKSVDKEMQEEKEVP
jgi:hypothetical protein